MQKSQLDAKTYGMGELITQRKLLVVPEHQRSFAWSPEETEQFLEDIKDAVRHNAVDYFIGVVVLQGPIHNTWVVLDGQQRLATTTMIFSSIREWLISRDFKEDAQQIENEFIGVRQLGGKYNARITMNSENRPLFEKFVVQNSPLQDVIDSIHNQPRKSSNRNLLESLKACREWLSTYTALHSSDRDEQARHLFEFAAYLEKRVKVVCVDVTSEADAYILFESLNDRGVDLSALDLVKNHIFKHTSPDRLSVVRTQWELIKSNIEGKDADDFLKVFWTSRFGIIQKVDLFRRFRTTYSDSEKVLKLVEELSDASEKLKAIDDSQHELWASYGDLSRLRMTKLNIIGTKQVRPVILSALSKFTETEVGNLLWLLIVLIVRYQLIGKERTGILEKSLAKIAQFIWNGSLRCTAECQQALTSIMPDDDSFYSKFCLHSETKASRVAYLLAELEGQHSFEITGDYTTSHNIVHNSLQVASADFILKGRGDDQFESTFLLGNRALLEYPLLRKASKADVPEKISQLYPQSQYLLSSQLGTRYGNDFCATSVRIRTEHLADLATRAWTVDSSLQVPIDGI